MGAVDRGASASERRHLRREVRTALELAMVALAPPTLVDKLAAAAGFLEALEELPTDPAPLPDLARAVVDRAVEALDQWNTWRPSRIPDPA